MSLDRRSLGGGAFALFSTDLEEAGFMAAFTERSGGVSDGVYASLNLSFSSGDDPARVAANREQVIRALGTPPFALGGQVHGAGIVRVGPKRAGAGFDGPDGVLSGYDGLYSSSPGLPLAVATADCTPVILGSPGERLLAVVHAGWRGVAAGIATKTVALFADPKEVRAAIGPAAGPCHYEVGEDVALAVSASVPGGAVTERRDGAVFLDLPASIERALRAAGVRRIEAAGLCTMHEDERFFSHRRDGPCGRQFAIGMRLA